jgi:WD40 repeat protein
MQILQAGDSVIYLRFLPDGQRLLAGVMSAQNVAAFDLWTLPDGGRKRLLPHLNTEFWWSAGYGYAVAIHPTGEWGYLSWGGRLLSFCTGESTPPPVPEEVKPHQVVISPRGDRLLAADLTHNQKQLFAMTADASGATVVWRRPLPPNFRNLAGFLPDGERFVTIADTVRISTFATDDEAAVVRYPSHYASESQLSPDGRYLGVIGYKNVYLFDTPALGKPRRICRSAGGDYIFGFAFHPGGRTMAVIHGGPTLVKIYDLETLRRVLTFTWRLGPLACVAFSPDGMLGAAGSRDGRVVDREVDT